MQYGGTSVARLAGVGAHSRDMPRPSSCPRVAANRPANRLPALVLGQTVVVIPPLIALMQHQVAQLGDI